MSLPLRARIVSTDKELKSLRPEWNDLLAGSSVDCLFLSWEWLSLWWRYVGNDGRRHLQIIEVRDSVNLVGLAPLVSVDERFEFMGTGEVGSDYLDVIVRDDRREEVLESLAEILTCGNRGALFAQLLPGSNTHELLKKIQSRGYPVSEYATNVCPFLSLEGHTWETFMSTLGKRHRENVRRRLRKLGEGFSFEGTQTEQDLDENFSIFLDLHRRRWESSGGSDGLSGERVVEFHREFSELALNRGWLRLFVLRIEGVPAAAVYGFHRRGRTLYYQSGVDPARSQRSPGLTALALFMRHAIEEGATEFDFLHGNESYKFLWTDTTRQIRTVKVYPPSIEGKLNLKSDLVIRAAKKMARYVISKS